ncbi:hypothetical protein EXIGLDRAFT_751221 [Exidia glandulosa HHB12029]|uniref:MYND-type domain-containing protein n=1 Tax=Exidia glandulosa HHB12029 TaxID=1314781 RepID=A0A165FPX7_EXIGL|nr:hypothetical protein EXIGLDRAFT_751221 [Exidia glandulosa HHB12029]
MPGPGGKKNKNKPTPRPVPAALDLADAPLNACAERICAVLELPELKTRSGLKHVHKDFDTIQRKLTALYHAHPNDDRVLGGIVVIWGKLSSDIKLRDMLLAQGVLDKIVLALARKPCQVAALRVLALMTTNGGEDARKKVANATTSSILDIMNAERGSRFIVDLCVSILSHALSGRLDHSRLEPRSSSFPWARVLDSLLDVLATPGVSSVSFDHAQEFLVHGTQSLRHFYLANPRAIRFIVALVHSDSLEYRCTALFALMNLHFHAADSKISREVDPLKLMHVRWPQHISDVMVAYGGTRCEVYQIMNATVDYQQALMKAAQDGDLIALGSTLYALIMRNERSVARGMFQDEYGKPIQTMLPFMAFEDSLPHCAKALEALGPDAKLAVGNTRVPVVDMAAVLRIKSHMQKGRWDLARGLAQEGLARSPDELYFYYALSVGTSDTAEDQVRYARKGLKRVREGLRLPGAKGTLLPINESYVRLNMLMNSCEQAFFLASGGIWDALFDKTPWERVIAFLRISYEDSKTYIRDSPPDTPNLHRIIVLFVLNSFVWDGPSYSPDLRELKSKLNRLKIAEEIATLAYNRPERIGHRLAFETIIDNYAVARDEWDAVIARFGNLPREAGVVPDVEIPEERDELFEWLDTDSCGHHNKKRDETFISRWSVDVVELYRCSSCGNPSAVLRKCSRCGMARYCDQACQKKDWADGHKKHCLSDPI